MILITLLFLNQTPSAESSLQREWMFLNYDFYLSANKPNNGHEKYKKCINYFHILTRVGLLFRVSVSRIFSKMAPTIKTVYVTYIDSLNI
jgi:hypothetical protein